MSRGVLATPAGPQGRKWMRAILGLLVSAAALWVALRQVDLEHLVAELERARWDWVAAGVASLAVGYWLRIYRWALMLEADGKRVSSRACAAPFLGSIALNNLIPFRAGDLVRALVFPVAIDVSRASATASLILERLLDLLTILMALAIAVHVGPADRLLPDWVGPTAVALAAVASVCMISMFCLSYAVNRAPASLSGIDSKWNRPMRMLKNVVLTLHHTSRPPVFAGLLALSAAVWAAETGLYWAVSKALGLGFGFFGALFVCAIGALATLVPSAPGYVGTFHLAAYTAVFGVTGDSSGALSFAVVAHFAFWVPTTVAGSWVLIRNPALFRLTKR